MKEKRGQAAMEFLMTYGWAILAAVIVIGVLAAFGVFSPSKYIPKQCILTAPLGCVSNQVSATTNLIQFVMTNGLGESIDVSNVTIDGCGFNSTAMTVTDGQELIISVTCSPPLSASSKFNGAVSITYRTIGGLIDTKSTGSITVQVE